MAPWREPTPCGFRFRGRRSRRCVTGRRTEHPACCGQMFRPVASAPARGLLGALRERSGFRRFDFCPSLLW